MAYSSDQGRVALYLARGEPGDHSGRLSAAPGPPGAHTRGQGPAALGHAPVRLRTLVEPRPGGKAAPITPLGYKTAVRGLPRILAALDEGDPRLRAAKCLADTMERIGSVRGADWQGTATKSGQSDGGATTRVKLATRLALIEALANGWPVSRTGTIKRGPPRPALAVGRQTGNLKEIGAFKALVAMCVEGQPADEILRAHGWQTKSATRAKLRDGMLEALDDVADGLGFGRWNTKKA